MVIDLRALGTRDFGSLWILPCRPYDKIGDTCCTQQPDNENNTLNDRLHPNLKSDCTTLIRFLARG